MIWKVIDQENHRARRLMKTNEDAIYEVDRFNVEMWIL